MKFQIKEKQKSRRRLVRYLRVCFGPGQFCSEAGDGECCILFRGLHHDRHIDVSVCGCIFFRRTNAERWRFLLSPACLPVCLSVSLLRSSVFVSVFVCFLRVSRKKGTHRITLETIFIFYFLFFLIFVFILYLFILILLFSRFCFCFFFVFLVCVFSCFFVLFFCFFAFLNCF